MGIKSLQSTTLVETINFSHWCTVEPQMQLSFVQICFSQSSMKDLCCFELNSPTAMFSIKY